MNRLTNRDLDSLLRAIRKLHSHAEFKSLPERVVSLLAQLLPCEISSYNEVDRLKKQLRAVHNSDPGAARHFPAYMAHAHEHPIPKHVAETGDLTAHTLTDFLPRAVFERKALFNEFYRYFKIHHQIAYFPAASKELDIALFLFRNRQDFSERDRLMLNHFGPHIAQALRNGEAFNAVFSQAQAQNECIRFLEVGIVSLVEGNAVWASEFAREWLDLYFPKWFHERDHLPRVVRDWLPVPARLGDETLIAKTQKPLVVNRISERLIIRYLAGTEGKATILIKRERLFASAVNFEHAGLTRRESEVLHWICEGKSNPEIGILLGVSPNTIRKHVEHVLAKLGVESRAAAMRRALDL